LKKSLFIFAVFSSIFLFPANIKALWVSTGGPPSAPVWALAASGGNLYAGTNGGGVFLSTNNGASGWTAVNNGLTYPVIYSLAASGGNLFAGTKGAGICLSTNNGTNWTAVNKGLTNPAVYSLAASGTSVFAGTTVGMVFFTTNNGANWDLVNDGISAQGNVLSLAASGDSVFAGTSGGGVFFARNYGHNWTAVNNGLTNPAVYTLAMSGGNLFAGTDGGGVFLSKNNGASWTAVNTGLTSLYVRALAVSESTVFAGTAGGVFLTTNNGSTWFDFNAGLPDFPHVLALTTAGGYLFAGLEWTPGVMKRPLSDMYVPAATPVLSSPADGAADVAYTPTLRWDAASEALTYCLQVSTSISFTSMIVNDSTLKGTSKEIGPLAGAKTYYWRVRAKNAFGTSSFSTVWSFTTGMFIPQAPGLISPVHGVTMHVPNPGMIWNGSLNAASYTLNISTKPDFFYLVINQSGIASTSQHVGKLPDSATYYWRVNAANSAGTSPWSATDSFTIAIDTVSGLVGCWRFDEGVGIAAHDMSGYNNNGTIHGASWCDGKYGKALLFNGTDNYVRIPHSNSLEITGDFTIMAWVRPALHSAFQAIFSNQEKVTPYKGFELALKANGRVSFSVQEFWAIFSITPADTGVWTHIAVSFSGTIASVYINGNFDMGGGAFPVPAANALDHLIGASNDSSSFWRGAIDEVRIYKGCLSQNEIMGLMNPEGTFVRKEAGAHFASPLLLMRNNPNPFKHSTAIHFRVMENGPVVLRICSTDGKLVKTLINGYRQPGAYTVPWDGSNERGNRMSSGVYIYQLVGQGMIASQKMFLLD
jgi:hypothetical protein